MIVKSGDDFGHTYSAAEVAFTRTLHWRQGYGAGFRKGLAIGLVAVAVVTLLFMAYIQRHP